MKSLPKPPKIRSLPNQPHKSAPFARYLKQIVLQSTVLLSLFVALSLVLEGRGLLIAPQFLASVSFDEKLKFFRETQPTSPQITALGSSITMNHLDADLLQDSQGQPLRLINLANYGLQAEEWKSLAQLSIELFGKPEAFLVISSPVDFEFCPDSPEARPQYYSSIQTVNQHDVFQYLHSQLPAVYFHAKNRSIWRMMSPQLALQIQDLRTRQDTLESLQFDASGSVPLNVTREQVPIDRWNGLEWSDLMANLEPSNRCYQSLQAFVDYVKQENIPLLFVAAPIRSHFLDQFDPNREKLTFHTQTVAGILASGGFELWNSQQELADLTDDDFADAMHLNQHGAQRLTQYISRKTIAAQESMASQSNELAIAD